MYIFYNIFDIVLDFLVNLCFRFCALLSFFVVFCLPYPPLPPPWLPLPVVHTSGRCVPMRLVLSFLVPVCCADQLPCCFLCFFFSFFLLNVHENIFLFNKGLLDWLYFVTDQSRICTGSAQVLDSYPQPQPRSFIFDPSSLDEELLTVCFYQVSGLSFVQILIQFGYCTCCSQLSKFKSFSSCGYLPCFHSLLVFLLL